MSTVLSFAEESCWDGERFRTIRRPVIFVLAVNIPTHGFIRHEFEADFGVFYDVDDTWLVDLLNEQIPQVDWGWAIYHKKIDHSAIMIHNPDSGRVMGQIFPRGTKNQQISGDLPEGVASMDKWRECLEKRRVENDCTESS